MTPQTKIPLGQLLIERNIITREQLDTALKKQKESGELLGVILLECGFVDEETVFLPLLAGQFGVDYVNLKDLQIPQEVIKKVPAKVCSHYNVIPVRFENNLLTIATTQPLDVQTQDEISLVVNAGLNPVLASRKDISEAIRHYYGVGAETIEQMMDTVQPVDRPETETADIGEADAEVSISRFLNQILLEAYRDRATDIHIEPFEDELRIRYRVDGILYDAKVPANIKHFKDAIISRVKILANLNIAEKRLPQDGRFKVKAGGTDLDLRVSFLPTPSGESVVLRLLNTTKLYRLEELGLSEDHRGLLERLIAKPHGIIFLTGPTGSGKTTTLYSCLSRVDTGDKKIITIEDPVEYQLKGVTQIQINPAIGLTFAQGLRSMLRHDPDIMMVGEVRDTETATTAIQVALTGHLIFSTLHTNDAAGGVTRLLDMGIEPYLITSTVECFIAQRLVRTLCPACKYETKLDYDIMKKCDERIGEDRDAAVYDAKGCKACHFLGYAGRQPIYEFLVMSEDIRRLIMRRATAGQIKEAAVSDGMTTLFRSGWEKVKKGMTTPREVLRVTREKEN